MKQHIDWDEHYGKTFKLVKTPEGRQLGREWSPDLVSVVTPENNDAWTDWEELEHEKLQRLKAYWGGDVKTFGPYNIKVDLGNGRSIAYKQIFYAGTKKQ
jgi:hypothetical protein